ncbi:MAG TPA: gluconeogenesis factor YvcK family protein [Candidatus Sulfotelmatobacter sp.]|nr:gluconeogenesis factor YvcK family protein [Candidatus Sulfotelmatobacter sp.]
MTTKTQGESTEGISSRGLRVVAIGGGTGLSTLLRGLRQFVPSSSDAAKPTADVPTISDLSAVVTVSDDGGSSGRLRKEFNMLPPGDIRNCIVALSEDEALLSRLFRHRFEKGSGLEGHSFGNLFLAALTSLTSDFSEAVRLSSEILLTRGHIYPATTSNIELEAIMQDGTRVRGETKITASKGRIVELVLVPPDVEPMSQTLEAIAQANIITIGPGSLFTSLIPNLLVTGIPQAIERSPAVKIYICNLMTQANESLGLSAADHIRALNNHAHAQIFDYALLNRTPVSEEMRSSYAREGACQIVNDLDAIEALGVIPVLGDYLEEAGVARHNTARVAHDVVQLAVHAQRTVRGDQPAALR